MKKKLLLCPVDYFTVVYKINPWMNPRIPVTSKRAQKQWNELVSLYTRLDFEISLIGPVKSLPDMVFTANGFFSIGKKAIVARFRYKQRQGETIYYTQWLNDNGFEVIDPKDIYYEGQGDTFLVGERIYQGWGFRSDKEICGLLKKTFPEKQVLPLHLIDERFYHLDTCFFPVHKDLVYYYDGAFDTASLNIIQQTFKNPIAVSQKEACTFALNSIAFNHTVVTNAKAKKFAQRLRSDGLRVFCVELDEFMKSGGSVKCLTNEL